MSTDDKNISIATYLWTVKICCQHDNWVSQDICSVCTSKKSLPELRKKKNNSKFNILGIFTCYSTFQNSGDKAWLTLGYILNIWQQISPLADQFFEPLLEGEIPLETDAELKQNPFLRSHAGLRTHTWLLCWIYHCLPGTPQPESKIRTEKCKLAHLHWGQGKRGRQIKNNRLTANTLHKKKSLNAAQTHTAASPLFSKPKHFA